MKKPRNLLQSPHFNLTINYDYGNVTIVMQSQTFTVSKSQFKPKALEYLRKVEKEKRPLTITHAGKPVVKVVPIKDEDEDEKILRELGDSIISYGDIVSPVGVDDWEALK